MANPVPFGRPFLLVEAQWLSGAWVFWGVFLEGAPFCGFERKPKQKENQKQNQRPRLQESPAPRASRGRPFWEGRISKNGDTHLAWEGLFGYSWKIRLCRSHSRMTFYLENMCWS